MHAYIVGEHGDSQIPVLSSACIAGVALEKFCQQLGMPYEENALGKSPVKRDIKVRTLSFLGQTIYAEIPLEPKRYSSAHRLEGKFKCVLLQT